MKYWFSQGLLSSGSIPSHPSWVQHNCRQYVQVGHPRPPWQNVHHSWDWWYTLGRWLHAHAWLTIYGFRILWLFYPRLLLVIFAHLFILHARHGICNCVFFNRYIGSALKWIALPALILPETHDLNLVAINFFTISDMIDYKQYVLVFIPINRNQRFFLLRK